MKTMILSVICLATLTTQALASSAEAWSALDKAVVASCTRASGLKKPTVVGKAAQFDDRVGYVALLLQGQYPQKHMQGQSGTELCLYSKRHKSAYVTEWDSIRAPMRSQ